MILYAVLHFVHVLLMPFCYFTLHCFCKCVKGVLNVIMGISIPFFKIGNPHTRNDGLLRNYCDGDIFRQHPVFSCDPKALQLILYFDEFEVCNPPGSSANKHKIGLFIL